MNRPQPIPGRGFVDDAQNRDAARDAGFKTDREIPARSQGEKFVAVFCQQVLISGDYGLAFFKRSTHELKRLISASRSFHYDVHVFSLDNLFPVGDHACAGRGVLGLYARAPAHRRHFELEAASLLDEVGVLGNNVCAGAADGPEANYTDTDLPHRF